MSQFGTVIEFSHSHDSYIGKDYSGTNHISCHTADRPDDRKFSAVNEPPRDTNPISFRSTAEENERLRKLIREQHEVIGKIGTAMANHQGGAVMSVDIPDFINGMSKEIGKLKVTVREQLSRIQSQQSLLGSIDNALSKYRGCIVMSLNAPDTITCMSNEVDNLRNQVKSLQDEFLRVSHELGKAHGENEDLRQQVAQVKALRDANAALGQKEIDRLSKANDTLDEALKNEGKVVATLQGTVESYERQLMFKNLSQPISQLIGDTSCLADIDRLLNSHDVACTGDRNAPRLMRIEMLVSKVHDLKHRFENLDTIIGSVMATLTGHLSQVVTASDVPQLVYDLAGSVNVLNQQVNSLKQDKSRLEHQLLEASSSISDIGSIVAAIRHVPTKVVVFSPGESIVTCVRKLVARAVDMSNEINSCGRLILDRSSILGISHRPDSILHSKIDRALGEMLKRIKQAEKSNDNDNTASQPAVSIQDGAEDFTGYEVLSMIERHMAGLDPRIDSLASCKQLEGRVFNLVHHANRMRDEMEEAKLKLMEAMRKEGSKGTFDSTTHEAYVKLLDYHKVRAVLVERVGINCSKRLHDPLLSIVGDLEATISKLALYNCDDFAKTAPNAVKDSPRYLGYVARMYTGNRL